MTGTRKFRQLRRLTRASGPSALQCGVHEGQAHYAETQKDVRLVLPRLAAQFASFCQPSSTVAGYRGDVEQMKVEFSLSVTILRHHLHTSWAPSSQLSTPVAGRSCERLEMTTGNAPDNCENEKTVRLGRKVQNVQNVRQARKRNRSG